MQANYKNKLWELYETVGQQFVELIINLLAMVIVARSFDLAGFGLFSYLAALFYIASFVSEAGVCAWFRNRYALEKAHEEDLKAASGALFCTGLLLFLFFLITAVFDTSHTRIEESVAAYLIIAAAVPLRNGNRLRINLLHVTGQHRFASRVLMKKNVFFLLAIWVLTQVHQPSLLISAFLFSEIYQRIILRKKAKVPWFFQSSFFTKSFQTVNQSLRHLFSGEALNLIFHTDLFILGLFMASSRLGIYAEAALFGRFFLLIPVGIRPIIHRHFAGLAANGEALAFSKNVHKFRAYMFYIHALLALVLLIYFDETLHLILRLYGSEMVSNNLFTLMLPGYLFYAAVIVNESALEASGNAPFLSRISAIIVGINVLLSFYLIPFTGILGAAWSTLVCLLLYFFTLCSVKITPFSRIPVLEFLAAGAVVYLFYRIVVLINPPFILLAIVVPPVLYLSFYLLNFFDFDDYHVSHEPTIH